MKRRRDSEQSGNDVARNKVEFIGEHNHHGLDRHWSRGVMTLDWVEDKDKDGQPLETGLYKWNWHCFYSDKHKYGIDPPRTAPLKDGDYTEIGEPCDIKVIRDASRTRVAAKMATKAAILTKRMEVGAGYNGEEKQEPKRRQGVFELLLNIARKYKIPEEDTAVVRVSDYIQRFDLRNGILSYQVNVLRDDNLCEAPLLCNDYARLLSAEAAQLDRKPGKSQDDIDAEMEQINMTIDDLYTGIDISRPTEEEETFLRLVNLQYTGDEITEDDKAFVIANKEAIILLCKKYDVTINVNGNNGGS